MSFYDFFETNCHYTGPLESGCTYLPALLEGAWITVQITAGGCGIGVVLAFAAGLAGVSPYRALRAVSRAYVEFFRGTSALVQLFWLFYVLPLLGLELVPMYAGILALGLNIGAYGGEVVRGAINAVPRGQYEASTALNMSPALRMRRVIIPQAVVGMVPPFNNLFIELLKGTALVSLITIWDMTYRGDLIRAITGDTITVFVMLLAMYFVLAYGITLGMRALERWLKTTTGVTPKVAKQASVPAGGPA